MRALLFVLLGVGCTPGIDGTCETFLDLARRDAAERQKPLSPEREAKIREACKMELGEMSGRDEDAYGCSARCISRAADLHIAQTCISLCDWQRPEPGTASK